MIALPLTEYAWRQTTTVGRPEPGHSIRYNYSRAPYFERYRTALEPLFHCHYDRLIEVTTATTRVLLDAFEIQVPTRPSSEMRLTQTKDDLILEILTKVGATLTFPGRLATTSTRKFKAASNRISCYHDYVHPRYPQVFEGFQPDCRPRSLA